MKHMDTAKKRRGWRKALALLITLVLVCGLAAPAYAEGDQETTETTQVEQENLLNDSKEEVTQDPPVVTDTNVEEPKDGVVLSDEPSQEDTEQSEDQGVPAEEKPLIDQLTEAQTCAEMLGIMDKAGDEALATLTDDNVASLKEKVDAMADDGSKEAVQAKLDGLSAKDEGGTEPSNEPTQSETTTDEPTIGSILDGLFKTTDLNDTSTLALDDIEIAVGESKDVSGSVQYSYNHSWTSSDKAVATVRRNGSTATVTGVSAGTAKITHTYTSWLNNTKKSETFTVTVTPKATNVVTVQVFVCAEDPETHERYSQEMFGLLGLKALNDIGENKIWFTVGTVQIDLSQLSNSNTSAYIQTPADWEIVKTALANLNTNCLSGASIENIGNKVSEYRDQAKVSYGQGSNSGYTALFQGDPQYSDFVEGTLPEGNAAINYHLDLRFNCNKITFMTGKNNISGTDSNADDFSEIDSRVYITGSIIQPPRGGVTAPKGYKVLPGYYKDPDFTEEIDPIGQPLTEDMTVYVKIVPLDNAVVNYKVAQGDGTVSVDMESFNPANGSPTGSTATPDSGWAFEGWYSDEACTTKVSSDPTYKPSAPEDGWMENTNLTFYAKFVPADTTVTITKTVTGGLGDKDKDFTFTVTVKQGNNDAIFNIGEASYNGTTTFTLHNGQQVYLVVPVGSTVTVTETDYTGEHGGYTTTYTVNNGTKKDGREAVLTAQVGDNTIVFTNHKEASPDTGVLLDSLPYVLILAAVAVAAVLMVSRKRRSRDAD